MPVPYKHEPLTTFKTDPTATAEIISSIKKVESELGKKYPIIIDGKFFESAHIVHSINPANKAEIIGRVHYATKEIAEQAIQSSLTHFETWKNTSASLRAGILFRAAAIVRRRKHEFNAWLVKEVGKTWAEADGETAECIDFLEYYGRQILELSQGRPLNHNSWEHNEFTYLPLGVGIVIPPFNFSLAIMAGTVVAAVVTGNTVVLKPAETAPVIAAKFMEVLKEAGLPDGIVNYLPGSGAEIGDYLVDHPKTRFISFTGSRAVGCRIYERAAKVHEGQIWLKRVIAEMGGKDTIIVDKEADIELAAQSITKSAFAYSGQKCSACSRAVVHEAVYDAVLERVVELTEQLIVGNPTEETTFMGPVISEQSFEKIKRYIEIGKTEGRLMTGGQVDDSTGYFVEPTIFADIDENARLMKEEIFGPVLAFSKAKDFDHLLQIANNTDYGLTGAVISQNAANIERAKREFHVGNLYINRGCTAAIVGYQPFGGFNMSGTDSKAGSPDYLLLHVQAKSISETF
ncbi:L-glutamate gamma-semialdehyde dehydrogenase [Solibacillus sp. MA9]|uniref:L-glutamate gamma-semialdehyde dehydrogenase n=1 Tax=Solibacillus palustris TaxID=2908203 RepID=A0ABS9UAA2_9BACL|nr:L-glutamate gamma-semialdehyde dehydrogenase [Solibacillus sp. MA9]MCH7321260.1 L-glutamate gamma-semialdehyde dehydrogenase [Solibacillus sp. MA9]